MGRTGSEDTIHTQLRTMIFKVRLEFSHCETNSLRYGTLSYISTLSGILFFISGHLDRFRFTIIFGKCELKGGASNSITGLGTLSRFRFG